MATRKTVVIYDDLDGSTDDVGTYRFALNGVAYEIDLSSGNFDRMAAAFAPFIAAGRRVPISAAKKQSESGTNTGRRIANARIRQWWAAHWREQDLPEFRTRGAIPPAVRVAYDAAH